MGTHVQDVTTGEPADAPSCGGRKPSAGFEPPDPRVPGSRTRTDSRISRQAVIGFLTFPVGVVLPTAALALSGPEAAIGWPLYVLMVGLPLTAIGVMASVHAWVDIVGSRGELRGVAFAIAGTLLPLVAGAALLLTL